jgi:HD-GYP domain-containing protein (c-di-GMP phosphodiesterase class II)
MHELQQQLTNQRTPLTPEQQELVQQHPLLGADILRQASVDSPIWLSIVENHHETANGTGYPRGIREMDDDTVLLRTLDLYCAKISPRMHRKPMSGTQAERVLFTDTGTSSDNIFIPALIKEIGNYPPGSFVKLVNGEIAVVYKRSASIDMPQVLSLINDKGDPLIEPIRRDTSREQFKIVKDVLRETILININPAKIWSD